SDAADKIFVDTTEQPGYTRASPLWLCCSRLTVTVKEPANAANPCFPVVQGPHRAWASFAIPIPGKAATADPHLTSCARLRSGDTEPSPDEVCCEALDQHPKSVWITS